MLAAFAIPDQLAAIADRVEEIGDGPALAVAARSETGLVVAFLDLELVGVAGAVIDRMLELGGDIRVAGIEKGRE
jgi:hypothetical protein